jgi:hypothetical protein
VSRIEEVKYRGGKRESLVLELGAQPTVYYEGAVLDRAGLLRRHQLLRLVQMPAVAARPNRPISAQPSRGRARAAQAQGKKVLGWSRRRKLAHAFLLEYSFIRLKLAQLLGQCVHGLPGFFRFCAPQSQGVQGVKTMVKTVSGRQMAPLNPYARTPLSAERCLGSEAQHLPALVPYCWQ